MSQHERDVDRGRNTGVIIHELHLDVRASFMRVLYVLSFEGVCLLVNVGERRRIISLEWRVKHRGSDSIIDDGRRKVFQVTGRSYVVECFIAKGKVHPGRP